METSEPNRYQYFLLCSNDAVCYLLLFFAGVAHNTYSNILLSLHFYTLSHPLTRAHRAINTSNNTMVAITKIWTTINYI